MADSTYDDLQRDLALLGRSIDTPSPSEDLSLAVMARIPFLPPPAPLVEPTTEVGRRWATFKGTVASALDTRRRRLAIVVGTVLLALLATPPVRAAVADWFGFGGVIVERGSPDSGPAAPPPEVTEGKTVTEAAAAVDFPVLMPGELGPPDGVEVSPDSQMVSMSWSTAAEGVVRLDQFDAGLDFAVLKQTPVFLFTEVAGRDAVWFEEPHDVALLDADGSQRTESARLAGHTLIWLYGDATLRLEGDLSLERAKEIAESSVQVG